MSVYRFFHACEDGTHAWVVRRLVDEVVVESVDWLRQLDSDSEAPAGYWRSDSHTSPMRIFAGLSDDDEYFDIHRWREAVDGMRVGGRRPRLNGFVSGRSAGPNVWPVRACLLLAQSVGAKAAIVVTDVDDQPERASALRQVLDDPQLRPGFPALLASPEPEIEAWIICGFVPVDGEERAALADLCSELSFDPTREPHRLSSKGRPPERDAKRVCARLCQSREREHSCISVDRLEQRGLECGATQFIGAIRSELLPDVRVHLGSSAG